MIYYTSFSVFLCGVGYSLPLSQKQGCAGCCPSLHVPKPLQPLCLQIFSNENFIAVDLVFPGHIAHLIQHLQFCSLYCCLN